MNRQRRFGNSARPSLAARKQRRQRLRGGAAQHHVRVVVDVAVVRVDDDHLRAAAPRQSPPARPPARRHPRCRPPASRRTSAPLARRRRSQRAAASRRTTPRRAARGCRSRRNAAAARATRSSVSHAGARGQRLEPAVGEDVAVQADRVGVAGALVQVVDVLRDHRQHAGPAPRELARAPGGRRSAAPRRTPSRRSAYQSHTSCGSARKPSSLASCAGSKRDHRPGQRVAEGRDAALGATCRRRSARTTMRARRAMRAAAPLQACSGRLTHCAAAAPRTGTRPRPPTRSGSRPRRASECAPARRRSCA